MWTTSPHITILAMMVLSDIVADLHLADRKMDSIKYAKVQVPAAQDTQHKTAGIMYTRYTKPAHKTSVL